MVTVNFFGSQFDGSLAFIVLLAVGAGMLIFTLFTLPSAIRDSWEFSVLVKHNKKLAKELEAHKELLSATQSKLVDVATTPTHTVVIEKDTSSVK